MHLQMYCNTLAELNGPAVVCVKRFACRGSNKVPAVAAEDQYGVIAQYYSLPWLSLRDVVYRKLMAEAPRFKATDMFLAGDERHPNALGHKYIADLAVGLVQQTFLDSLLAVIPDEELAKHPLLQVGANMANSRHLVCCHSHEDPPPCVCP
jgi:hypothetical protein